jgi:hypothetical protein
MLRKPWRARAGANMGPIRLLAALIVGGAHAIDDIQQQYLPAVPRWVMTRLVGCARRWPILLGLHLIVGRPVYQAIRPRHRHACGYRLANDGVDTRALQAYLGYRNIQDTTPTPRWRPAGSRGSFETDHPHAHKFGP